MVASIFATTRYLSPGSSSPYNLVTTNNWMNSAGFAPGTNGRVAMPAGKTNLAVQTHHKITVTGATEYRIVVPGRWYVDSGSGSEANLAADVVIDEFWLRVGTTLKQVTFGGSPSLTVGSADYYLSDAITPADLGTPVADTVIFQKSRWHVLSDAAPIMQGTPAYHAADTSAINARAYAYPTSDGHPVLNSTSYILKPTNASFLSFAPSAFLVALTPPAHKAIAVFADSLGAYNENVIGGVAQYPVTYAGMGPYQRATLDPTTGLNSLAMIVSPCHSELTISFINASARRRSLLDFCNIGHVAYGTNEIGFAGTPAITGPALTARVGNAYDLVKGHSKIQKVVGSTIPPFTTSTDVWATTANQSGIVNGWDIGQHRFQLNSYVTSLAGGKINAAADLAAIAQDSVDPRLWAVNGTAKWMTDEGKHWGPNASGNAGGASKAVAVAIRAAWNSLTVT